MKKLLIGILVLLSCAIAIPSVLGCFTYAPNETTIHLGNSEHTFDLGALKQLLGENYFEPLLSESSSGPYEVGIKFNCINGEDCVGQIRNNSLTFQFNNIQIIDGTNNISLIQKVCEEHLLLFQEEGITDLDLSDITSICNIARTNMVVAYEGEYGTIDAATSCAKECGKTCFDKTESETRKCIIDINYTNDKSPSTCPAGTKRMGGGSRQMTALDGSYYTLYHLECEKEGCREQVYEKFVDCSNSCSPDVKSCIAIKTKKRWVLTSSNCHFDEKNGQMCVKCGGGLAFATPSLELTKNFVDRIALLLANKENNTDEGTANELPISETGSDFGKDDIQEATVTNIQSENQETITKPKNISWWVYLIVTALIAGIIMVTLRFRKR